MRILITGSTGFIGKNLKDYFLNRDDDVFCPGHNELELLDAEAVETYVKDKNIDIVLQCAVTLESIGKNLKIYFNLERCSRYFGKLICIGSGAEYDMKNYIPRMKEDYFGKHIPSDIYGFSKYVIAKDIESRHRNIFNLRVFGIYGKYENYQRRFISNNICRVLSGLNISINRNMYFDYLVIDDFIKILELFIVNEPEKRSYNVCTGKSISLYRLAEIIRDIDGRGLSISVKEEGYNPEYTGDNSLLLDEFPDITFTEPEKAIAKLYEWYKHRVNEISLDTN